MSSRKWTTKKIQNTVNILRNNTNYQEALKQIGETSDSVYNAFQRLGMKAPSTYLRSKAPSEIQTLVIFNDVHIPFHHVQGCENVLEFCRDIQPDNIAINGDFLDCYSLSSFPKEPGSPSFQEEIDLGKDMLTRLRRYCPDAEIDYLEGNHEERLKRVIREQRAFYNLKALNLPTLLGLEGLNIHYHAYKHPVDYGPLTVVHGHRVSKHSGASAKAHLLDDGYQNVVIGHTHRMGTYFHSGHSGIRRAFENGGLFDASQLEYVVGPNWQNGFCVVYLKRNDPSYLQIVPIEMGSNCEFVWNGKMYGK